MKPYPVVAAKDLPVTPPDKLWLVESLWGREAVGFIGGEPKCGKSLLALEIAVSVASGRRCLGEFEVHKQGPVLYFAAEDALDTVGSRLAALCDAAGIKAADLPLKLIDQPMIRLDVEGDCARLAKTIEREKPVLLILDPFVRLHRGDENASRVIVPLLAFLRELQRKYHCAVLIVHHFRKGADKRRGGQALRGSGDFHAWVDSALYLRREGDMLRLTAEHRRGRAPDGLTLSFVPGNTPAAVTLAIHEEEEETLTQQTEAEDVRVERVLAALAAQPEPVSLRALRSAAHVKTEWLSACLNALAEEGRVAHTRLGWVLVKQEPAEPGDA